MAKKTPQVALDALLRNSLFNELNKVLIVQNNKARIDLCHLSHGVLLCCQTVFPNGLRLGN